MEGNSALSKPKATGPMERRDGHSSITTPFLSGIRSGDIFQMSGHPPFGAQVMWNGHELVACQASQEKIDWQKEDHCFTESADAAGLAGVADTLSQSGAVERLSQVCERWLYTTCLVFGLDLEEQRRSGFRYQYSTYPVEYSRHLQFQVGPQRKRCSRH